MTRFLKGLPTVAALLVVSHLAMAQPLDCLSLSGPPNAVRSATEIQQASSDPVQTSQTPSKKATQWAWTETVTADYRFASWAATGQGVLTRDGFQEGLARLEYNPSALLAGTIKLTPEPWAQAGKAQLETNIQVNPETTVAGIVCLSGPEGLTGFQVDVASRMGQTFDVQEVGVHAAVQPTASGPPQQDVALRARWQELDVSSTTTFRDQGFDQLTLGMRGLELLDPIILEQSETVFSRDAQGLSEQSGTVRLALAKDASLSAGLTWMSGSGVRNGQLTYRDTFGEDVDLELSVELSKRNDSDDLSFRLDLRSRSYGFRGRLQLRDREFTEASLIPRVTVGETDVTVDATVDPDGLRQIVPSVESRNEAAGITIKADGTWIRPGQRSELRFERATVELRYRLP